MAIFLDTGFFLGLVHKKDENFAVAQEWLKKIQSGVYGQIYTSNHVIAETATLVAVRTRGSVIALERTRSLLKGELQIATVLYASEDEETRRLGFIYKVCYVKRVVHKRWNYQLRGLHEYNDL